MRAYLQLLRIPNVFTALADVMMGYLLLLGTLEPWPKFATIAFVSASLYLAGMALNDFFDREIDALERPNRPIPSGRVSAKIAGVIGFGLLLVGLSAAGWSILFLGDPRPAVVAAALSLCVLAYDGFVKAKLPWISPLVMALCRALNVLLGMITGFLAAPGGDSIKIIDWEHTVYSEMLPFGAGHFCILLGVFLYICGVTWFAQAEAEKSSRSRLIFGTALIMAGLAMFAFYPLVNSHATARVELIEPEFWWLFWIVLGLPIVRYCGWAIVRPQPALVQAAVKHCILSIIVIDAAVAVPVAGVGWAIVILALLAPATLLGQWIYST